MGSIGDRAVVLILSSDHSGSTWVGYVLGSLEDAAFLGEFYRGFNADLRQPCTTCAADGRRDCPVLGGVDSIAADQAVAWAFGRTQRRVLVDSSKSIAWAAAIIRQAKDCGVRLLHLVRDPRGWFASVRRRNGTLSVQEGLQRWTAENAAIHAFLCDSGQPWMAMSYDRLSADPTTAFLPLAAFCGLAYVPRALRYWEIKHHCFAANGATAMLVPDPATRHRLPHFLTGDDAFYGQVMRQGFVDQRWRTELSAEEHVAIRDDAAVLRLLAVLGAEISDAGVAGPAGGAMASSGAARSAIPQR